MNNNCIIFEDTFEQEMLFYSGSPRTHLLVVGMLWFLSPGQLSFMYCKIISRLDTCRHARRQRQKPAELAHSFLFCYRVYFCLYGPLNCFSFHEFSRQLSAFSLCSSGLKSASLVLSTIYLFVKVSLSPDVVD